MNPENLPIIGWARLLAVAGTSYCAVVELSDSVVTSCRGRWDALEPTHFIRGTSERDQDDDGITFAKCGACDEIARARGPVDCPVDNPSRGTSSATMTAPDWDLSDLGGDS